MRKKGNQKKCLIDRSICIIGIKIHRYIIFQDLCVINYNVSLINQIFVFCTAINGMNAIWVFTRTFPKLHPDPTKGRKQDLAGLGIRILSYRKEIAKMEMEQV